MTTTMLRERTADVVRRGAYPLTGERSDFDPLLSLIGEAPLVLIGEASHGSEEFYRERAAITRSVLA